MGRIGSGQRGCTPLNAGPWEDGSLRVSRIVETSRPDAPGYFEASAKGLGLLDWSVAEQRLVAARNYWLSTASAAAVPHAMPVWGVWLEGRFLFSTGPRTRKARNLVSNARAVVHLESGAQLVVVEGVTRQVSDATVVESFVSAYNPKYDWNFTVADLSSGELFEVRPLKAFAWLGDEGADFSAAGTRWVFEDPADVRRGSIA